MKKLLACLVLSVTLAACVPAPGAVGRWSDAPAEVQAEHSPEVIQAFIDAYWRQVWVDTYNYRKWMAAAVAYEARKAEAAAYPHGLCGGDLPPCWVMMRESRGDIRAKNPRSTASGKWQFLDGTWAGFGGYRHARDAPESVQDARARQLWAHGRGCSHWSAC